MNATMTLSLPEGAFELSHGELFLSGGGWWEDVGDWFSSNMNDLVDFLTDGMSDLGTGAALYWDYETGQFIDGVSHVADFVGNFYNGLENYNTTHNYIDEVFMPNQNDIAGFLMTALENPATPLTFGGAMAIIGDAVIIGTGLNTIEYWGSAFGTALGDAVYAEPPHP